MVLRHGHDRHVAGVAAWVRGGRPGRGGQLRAVREEVRAVRGNDLRDGDRDVVGERALGRDREGVVGARYAHIDGQILWYIRGVSAIEIGVSLVDVAAREIARLGLVAVAELRLKPAAPMVEGHEHVRGARERRHRERRRDADKLVHRRTRELGPTCSRLVREEGVARHDREVDGARGDAKRWRRVSAIEREDDDVADDVTVARAWARAHVGDGAADDPLRREEALVVARVVDGHGARRRQSDAPNRASDHAEAPRGGRPRPSRLSPLFLALSLGNSLHAAHTQNRKVPRPITRRSMT